MFEVFQVLNVWLVLVAIGGFQLFQQWTSQGRRRYEEGLPKVLQLLTGIPALLILAAFVLDPDLPNAQPMSMTALIDIGGLVIFNSAGLLVLWSHVALGNCWSGDLETRADHRLVEVGPYRFVRHPLYSSYVLMTIGLFLLSDNWWVGSALLLYFLSVASRTVKEEQMMVQCLGEQYLAYKRRTGRFLPKLGARVRAAGPHGTSVDMPSSRV